MGRIVGAVYGTTGWLAFVGTLGYFVGFLLDLGVPKSVDRGAGPLGPALAVDLALIAAFGVQHSVMARPGFKRWLTRRVPEGLERATYVWASTLVLAALMAFWRPVPAVLWEADGTAAAVLLGLNAAAWGVVLLTSFALSHAHLFGLSQTMDHLRGRDVRRVSLKVRPVLYRMVRHPMTSAVMVALWATPRMTAGHALLALGLTVYSIVGTWFEERDLIRSFGASYREYMRRVPRFVPTLPGAGRLARRATTAALVLAAGAGALLASGGPEEEAGGAVTPADRSLPAAERSFDRLSIFVGERDRTVEVYAPADLPAGAPVVLAFHGSGGSAARFRGFLGGELERLAERHGFLVAYPEAFQGSWNGCRARMGSAANVLDVDDPGFVRRVVGRLVRERGADPSRVYAVGFSGGGHMVYRLALQAQDLVRAGAVFAASLPVPAASDCAVPVRPAAPLMIVNGTHDLLVPWGGGDGVSITGRSLGPTLPSDETAAWLAERSGQDAVEHHALEGGGHLVPGPRTRFPAVLGRNVRDFDGLAEAVRFFGLACRGEAAGCGE